MVAALEQLRDLLVRKIQQLVAKIHRHLPRQHDFLVPPLRRQVFDRYRIIGSDRFLDAIRRYGRRVFVRQQILQRFLRKRHRDRDSLEARIRDHARQAAFQLPDVVLHVLGNVQDHVVLDVDVLEERAVFQDRDPRFPIRRLNIRDQSAFKPGGKPFFERFDLLRRPIGRNDDLLAEVVQRVERVEKFLLRAFPAGDKLDIVHHQHVNFPDLFPEFKSILLLNRAD